MEIRPVVAEFLHADRQKDRHCETNSQFSQFCQRALNAIVTLITRNIVESEEETVNETYYGPDTANYQLRVFATYCLFPASSL